jgi:hypothetical protein
MRSYKRRAQNLAVFVLIFDLLAGCFVIFPEDIMQWMWDYSHKIGPLVACLFISVLLLVTVPILLSGWMHGRHRARSFLWVLLATLLGNLLGLAIWSSLLILLHPIAIAEAIVCAAIYFMAWFIGSMARFIERHRAPRINTKD